MPASTDNQAFHPKSVYNRQHSTEGQTHTHSSGAFGLFESGSRLDMRGEYLSSVVVHTSNSTTISNRGHKVFNSTMDIKIALEAPVTGSCIKLIMQSTQLANDNAVYTFIVSNGAGATNARLGGTTGRQIVFSTQNATKHLKTMELIGTTQILGRRMWLISNVGRTTGVIAYTVSTSTA